MAFEGLTEKLQNAFKKLTGKGKLNEQNVKDAMREVRMALLEADVNYMVVKDFVKRVTEKCIGVEILSSLNAGQQVIKIVNDEMVALMGGTNAKLTWSSSVPTIYMLCGLQGAGKTTMAAKLAAYLTKQGKKPLLAACDIYRPAAIKQLQVVGEKVNVPVFEKGTQDPVKTSLEAIEYARYYGRDVLIIDTAGRLHIDEKLMEELQRIKAAVKPQEILLVVDAMTGQDAVNTAKAFNDKLNFDGVILTKMDGDTRGGAALTIKAVVNKPIKYIGTGEKMEALDVFHPDRLAERILGMGDIRSFVEKAQDQFDQEEAAKLQKKLAKNQFDFNDFLAQIQQIKKMGNVKDLMSMIPGMGKAIKDLDIDDNAFKGIEVIIQSMTPEERANPDIINGSRRKRIAKGSGSDIQDVNHLIKQFDETRKMMKLVNSGKAKNLIRAMNAPGRRPL